MRVTLTRGSMTRSQRDGGLPPDAVVQDEDTILADCQRLIARYHQTGPDALVQIALAPCSPFSVTTSLMQGTAELAARHRVRLHTHLAETADENRYCQDMHGCRPLDCLEQCGWLHRRGLACARRPFPDLGREMTRSQGPGRRCGDPLPVQQPDPRLRPLSGLRPGTSRRCRRAGCRWVGVEQCVQPDAGSARGVPVATGTLRRWNGLVTSDALRWATTGSANCIGRPELGVIRAGAPADLALYRLDELRFSGAEDPLAALVLCGAHRADRVMVGGRWVVERGAIPGLDLTALLHRHNESCAVPGIGVAGRRLGRRGSSLTVRQETHLASRGVQWTPARCREPAKREEHNCVEWA